MITIEVIDGTKIELPTSGHPVAVIPDGTDKLNVHLGINLVEIFRRDKEWVIRHNPNIVTEIVPIKYDELPVV